MTDTTNVLPIPMNVLAERIRSAYHGIERADEEKIKWTLELAAALAEARERFPSNNEFAGWLGQAGLDRLGAKDRVALIEMGRQPQVFRAVLLEQSEQYLPNTIWQKERHRFEIHFNTDLPAPIAENPPPAPAVAENPPAESDVSQPEPPEPPAARVSKRSPFYGFARADEVFAIYTNADARTTIGKAVNARGGKDIWSLILQALDERLLTQTGIAPEAVTLRVLFPWAPRSYCAGFDLTSANARKHVREHIMPAAIAKREALLASPDKTRDLIADYWRERQDEVRKAAEEERVTKELQTMPPNQRELTMYGVRVWPRPEIKFGTYDYEQICTAIWYFKDFDAWMYGRARNDPAERAIIIRFSTKWPLVYLARAFQDKPDERQKMEKVYQLICMLSRLLEANPNGECVTPPTPKVEGQW